MSTLGACGKLGHFRVEGLWGSGFRVQGLGLGYRLWGLGSRNFGHFRVPRPSDFSLSYLLSSTHSPLQRYRLMAAYLFFFLGFGSSRVVGAGRQAVYFSHTWVIARPWLVDQQIVLSLCLPFLSHVNAPTWKWPLSTLGIQSWCQPCPDKIT